MEKKEQLIITPKTKVLQLIETYPELEEVLIEYAPAFKKLKNPVLRKTVGRIATLQQAASIGNVNVEDLINRLRTEVGQDLLSIESQGSYDTSQPGWYNEDKVATEFDVREMLASGEHPVSQVIADLKDLKAGQVYKLSAPFLPAPLIDKATSLGFSHWVDKRSQEEFEIYFMKD